jgi:hypothetical protein
MAVAAAVRPADVSGNALLASRLFAAVVVAAAVALLDPLQMLLVTIVGGQGHFFASYYYQARAGKIDRRYVVAWVLAAAALFAAALLLGDILLLARAASLYFVIHLLHDELFLLGERPSPARGLEVLPVLLAYTGFLADLRGELVTVGSASIPYLVIAYPGELGSGLTRLLMAGSLIALGANAALLLAGRRALRGSALGLHAASLALLAVYASGIPIRLEYLMGVPILLHYVSWYAHYWLKYAGDPPRRTSYLRTILGANAIVLALYFATGRHPEAPFPVGLLFVPGFFYVWTILHIAFTTRRSDLGYWMVRPAAS